jgi:hypothetical protein
MCLDNASKESKARTESQKMTDTLTTEAPVANFFPSFFDASLSFTPTISGKNVRLV